MSFPTNSVPVGGSPSDAITLDVAADFEDIVDNLETVTFRRKAIHADTYTEVAGVTALRRGQARSEKVQKMGATVTEVALRWHLDVDGVGDPAPRPRDRIEDSSGVEWMVQRCSIATGGTRYACDCLKVQP